MNTPVHILVTCRNPALWEASEMVFKTIRTGFPTAPIVVDGNALSTEQSCSILEHMIRIDGTLNLRGATTHWEWIAKLIEKEPAPFFICDTDVVFWEDMEIFTFQGPMHGRWFPSFKCPVTSSDTVHRLHTALLYIDPAPFRHFNHLHSQEEGELHPFPIALNLVKPVRFAVTGRVFFHDTLGQAFSILGGHKFSESMLDSYDHISSGTWLDLLDKSIPDSLERQMERIRNPELARGLWRHQQKYCEERPI